LSGDLTAAQRATTKDARPASKALDVAARLPKLMSEYRTQVESALKEFSHPDKVSRAREATRRLIDGGRVVLKPTKDGRTAQGSVRLKGFGDHLLSMAGVNKVVAGARFPYFRRTVALL
jgi:hypothetical protein